MTLTNQMKLFQVEWSVVKNAATRPQVADAHHGVVQTLMHQSHRVRALSRILIMSMPNTDNTVYRDDRQLLLKYHAKRENTEG